MPSANVQENYIDGYWITVVSLLKAGIPWDMISSITDKDMINLLGTVQAIHEHEQEVQEREVRQSQIRMS